MNRYLSFIVFGILFSIYALTAYPAVTYTDNGELAAVLTSLGIAHPTGYPLFTILGHLWTYLPLPVSQIFELNLFSAFLTALSGAVFYLTSDILLKRKFKILALASSLVYGFGNIIWKQGISLEVYSLHLLMVNLIMFFSIRFYQKRNFKDLAIISLLLGLSFGNHLTTVLLIPSALIILFLKNSKKQLRSSKFWLILILLFLSGVSTYIYLPIRSSMEPLFDWGDVDRSLDKFLYHILGKQYQLWMFSNSNIMKTNLLNFFRDIPIEMNLLTLFIPFGFYGILKKHKVLFYFFLVAILSIVIYSSGYIIHDISSYFAPAFLIFELIAVYGIAYVYGKHKKWLPIVLLVPVISLYLNWEENNHSKDRTVEEYLNLITENLPENSIIISSQWDYWCAAFWYKQQIEGYRKDLILIEKELLRRTWYPNQLLDWYPVLEKSRDEVENYLEILEKFESGKNYDRNEIQIRFLSLLRSLTEKYDKDRRIFVSSDILSSEKNFALNRHKYPFGMLFELIPKDENFKDPDPNNYSVDDLVKMKRKYPSHLDTGLFEIAAISLAANAYYQMSEKNYNLAKEFAQKAIKLDENNDVATKVLNAVDQFKLKENLK